MEPVYTPIIGAARTVFAGLGLRFDIVGAEHIPTAGGAVLASNHIGYLDFTFCGLAAKRSGRLVRFMAKDSAFTHPISGPLMRGMKHIPVDRVNGARAYADAVRALKSGEIVGVFPEATVSRSFEIKEIKNGAIRMAMAADVPLIPMVVWGSQRVYTKGRKPDAKPGKAIAMTVGEPMRPRRGENSDEIAAELANRLRALLEQTIDRYSQAPDPSRLDGTDPEMWWMPARLGGTAPTLEEATEQDRAIQAERIRRREQEAGTSSPTTPPPEPTDS